MTRRAPRRPSSSAPDRTRSGPPPEPCLQPESCGRAVAHPDIGPNMKPTLLTLAATLLMTTTLSATAAVLPNPPDAAKKPHQVKAPHGAERSDEYYWLRDDKRKNPEMLAYLKAENAYV